MMVWANYFWPEYKPARSHRVREENRCLSGPWERTASALHCVLFCIVQVRNETTQAA